MNTSNMTFLRLSDDPSSIKGFSGSVKILYNGVMSDMEEFHPQLLSRQGEVTAWVTALLVCVTWIVLSATNYSVHPAIPFLAIILLFIAMGISLGNWMDRRTYIQIFPDRIHYENGLRRSTMNWEDVRQVQILPSNWGKKVRVIGQTQHFDFRTLGEVKVQGEIKGQMGFAEGEYILNHILEQSGLKLTNQTGNTYYYARK